MKWSNVWKMSVFVAILLFFPSAAAFSQTVADVNHWELQAVDANGEGTYEDSELVILEGVIINNPEEMLDPTADYSAQYTMWYMGGMWQMFIQGEGNDHAGTALWMGQNYGNLPWFHDPNRNYTNEEWANELCRLNHDPNTGYKFNMGDRVRVTGRYKFYGGKTNINENHNNNPSFNFTVCLLEPAVGLPEPEVIDLNDIKDANDNFIFDQTRTTGCEYYQGRLVRINDVSFVDANEWGPDEMITITDGTKTFPVHLGIGRGIYAGSNNLADTFDVIGIMNQEATGNPPDCTAGYEIWVVNYDGNRMVLTDRGYSRGNLSGDINGDGKVDFKDFAEFAAGWLECRTGLCDCGIQ